MRISTLLPTAFIALALSATVGCSVDVSGPATSGSAQSPTPHTADTGSSADSPPAADRPSAASSADAATTLKISGNQLTQSTDCTGRDVVIDGTSNVIALKGTCGTVTLNGSYNTVALETIDTIKIVGASDKVLVKTVGAIQLTGATYASVRWVGGVGGNEPDVSGTGEANSVKKISRQDYEDEIKP